MTDSHLFTDVMNHYNQLDKEHSNSLDFDIYRYPHSHFINLKNMEDYGTIVKIETEDALQQWIQDSIDLYLQKQNGTIEYPVLFRGHRDSSWLMKTTLLREAEGKNACFHELEKAHLQYVKTLLSKYENIHNEEQVIVYAQHYGIKSSLLDFSFNPLVALYFATEGNEPVYRDSELQYYFSVIEVQTSKEFDNWEKILSLSCPKVTYADPSIDYSSLKIQESVVSQLTKINQPVWIAEESCRNISNSRMDAQRGALVYLCKHGNYSFEEVTKGLENRKASPIRIQLKYVLISRALYNKVKYILEDHRITASSLLLVDSPRLIDREELNILSDFVSSDHARKIISDAMFVMEQSTYPQSMRLFYLAVLYAVNCDLEFRANDDKIRTCSWYDNNVGFITRDMRIRYLLQQSIPTFLLKGENPIPSFVNKYEKMLIDLEHDIMNNNDTERITKNEIKSRIKDFIYRVSDITNNLALYKKEIETILTQSIEEHIYDEICSGYAYTGFLPSHAIIHECDSIIINGYKRENDSVKGKFQATIYFSNSGRKDDEEQSDILGYFSLSDVAGKLTTKISKKIID